MNRQWKLNFLHQKVEVVTKIHKTLIRCYCVVKHRNLIWKVLLHSSWLILVTISFLFIRDHAMERWTKWSPVILVLSYRDYKNLFWLINLSLTLKCLLFNVFEVMRSCRLNLFWDVLRWLIRRFPIENC